MWSGPRNISTAMMRAWENRGDCVVVDEPFYACYLAATGADHPMREEVLRSQPRDWREVIRALAAPLPDGVRIQYQKQMTHHVVFPLEDAWLRTARHAFLIRDPYEIVASYVRKRAAVTAADLGIERQVEIYERIREATGQAPPIVEAADVLANPAGVLRALCEALNVSFTERMLSWPPGLRPSDGIWAAHWYDAVARSTGFARPSPSPDPAALPAEARAAAEACLPAFEYLRARKLRI